MKTKFMMFVAMALLCVAPAWAQLATIKGTCTDTNGKPLVGATVEYTNTQTGHKYELKTDKRGEYFSISVSPGTYNVKLIRDGKELTSLNGVPVTSAKEQNVYDFDMAKITNQAEQSLSTEEKAKREATAKENQKIQGLNGMLSQAKAAMDAGNFEQAVAVMHQATEADPTRDILWGKLCEADLAAGKSVSSSDRAKAQDYYKDAVAACNKALEIKPTVGAYNNNVAEAYAHTGKVQEAAAQYQLAAQNDPANAPKYYFNLGAVYTNAGSVDEANAAFDKALAADPNYAEAYYQKAVNLMGKATVDKDGQIVAPPEVSTNLNKYLQLSPTGPNAEPAKELLASLGAKVETSFGTSKPAKKK